MTGEADLARIGALLADRTRATILLTLLNGGLTPASALAERAQVSRSLASSHLRKLEVGGLVRVEPRGRQRLYRLASQSIADALEVLILLAPALPVSSLRGAHARDELRRGRLCYDHLAGRAGVALAEHLVAAGLLVPGAERLRRQPRGQAGVRRARDRHRRALGPSAAADARVHGLERAPAPPRRQPRSRAQRRAGAPRLGRDARGEPRGDRHAQPGSGRSRSASGSRRRAGN